MCGIFCSVGQVAPQDLPPGIQKRLQDRGPDSFRQLPIRIPEADHATLHCEPSKCFLTFAASVLSLRGEALFAQPVADSKLAHILCWNGEAWRIAGQPVVGNDTHVVFKHLVQAASCRDSELHGPSDPSGNCIRDCHDASLKRILNAVGGISGPYAFVFFDRAHQRILFARDILGRRSLLYGLTPDGGVNLASISGSDPSTAWTEVEADGLYVADLAGPLDQDRYNSPGVFGYSLAGSPVPIYRYPWIRPGPNPGPNERLSLPSHFPTLNKSLPGPHIPHLHRDAASVETLAQKLRSSLSARVEDVPSTAAVNQHVAELPRVAILFSGGVDCTVLARLVHDILPSGRIIDLLNVAFENPRVVKAARARQSPKEQNSGDAENSNEASSPLMPAYPRQPPLDGKVQGLNVYDLCPDRLSGRASLAELQQINIPYAEAISHREQIISLMKPHNTEMDLSIAYAFYFAARGSGVVRDPDGQTSTIYTSPARVLLSGLGADELFAGYSRHAAAFGRSGFDGLLDELELDFNRLGCRNLGRDDRVIGHWGKEVRYPYLDEDLVQWALASPVWEKCGFGQDLKGSNGIAEPGKLVLRLLAQILNMPGAASMKKRAVGISQSYMEIRQLMNGHRYNSVHGQRK
ncbi:MAG: ssDNA endonuclease and repair protein rad10 [Watsoniomyces obsoletus]|nr:MAG: ssDNA endonuclease and repair protein rad10 [Watsoniomyces obsoletus]